MALLHYRLRCQTDGDVFWWLDSADPVPTMCPINTAHIITIPAVVVGQQTDDCYLVSLSWTSLKALAVDQSLTQRIGYAPTDSGGYLVWLDYGGRMVETVIASGSADKTDFDTNYKPYLVPAVTQAGLPASTIMDFADRVSNFEVSCLYETPASTTAYYDYRIDGLAGPLGLFYLTSGEYEVWGSATKGSAAEFSIVDKDDVLGLFIYYGLHRCKLDGLTSIVGVFQVGETVTGGTSAATGVVLSIIADTLEIQADNTGTWQDGEVLTGGTSSATATLGTYVEGDVLPLIEYVSDEWLYTGSKRPVKPGGAKKLVRGLYLRAKVYNADVSNALTLKVTYGGGRE
jgi:hypothetical protein